MSGRDLFNIDDENGRAVMALCGAWTMENAASVRAVQKSARRGDFAVIDAQGAEKMDMWGAITLRDLAEKTGARLVLAERQQKLFDFLVHEETGARKEKSRGFYGHIADLGKFAAGGAARFCDIMEFIGRIAVCFARNLRHPSAFRFHTIVRHIEETGLRALPIIGLLAILISMVIAYQAATQLQKFGANIFTIDLTVISLLREMGVLITAIMVAGRSGSAFAAEIGVMKLREETDALRTMGMDPIEVLVLPRLIAMMITLPILAFLADIVGLAGGALISVILLDIPLDQYIDRVNSVATTTMFFVGLVKAPVFAFIITVIGTYQGMNVTGSAESVGKLTTLSVVQSIFLVIMADAVFSIVFARLGI